MAVILAELKLQPLFPKLFFQSRAEWQVLAG
jgi:hypothetical protein